MFLGFLFDLPPFWAILLISFVLTLATTIVYKYTTDQKRMLELKGQSKKYQERMKASRDDPQKMLKIQNEAMKVNLELMKHSFRPTLYTFLPIILIFWWLNAHLAYYNLAPQQDFTIMAQVAQGIGGNVTISFVPQQGITLLSEPVQTINDSKATWQLKADAGTYKASFTLGSVVVDNPVEKQFLVTTERSYETPIQPYKGAIEQVTIGNKVVHPLGDSFSLFGWYPGWLATYIVLSILVSIGLRKAFNVV